MMSSFLKMQGGYRGLRVYKVAEMLYDITFYFTQSYLIRGDRTVDQMIQAARSGKQNIAEGSSASTTSAETEIKLTNVARASLQELLIDYEDYLRVRKLLKWDASHPRYEAMRRFARSEEIMQEYPELLPKMNDVEIANLAITLLHQADFMLRRLLDYQQEQFLKQGGVREKMTRARLAYRKKENEK
ncbi:MAG: four helix bundle protein [Muribaculaceae bacterium]|nr:four helix bundle protein [Muribaculaceae bacterium]